LTNLFPYLLSFVPAKETRKNFSVAATELGVANEPKKTSHNVCLFILSFVPAKERTKENLSSVQYNS